MTKRQHLQRVTGITLVRAKLVGPQAVATMANDMRVLAATSGSVDHDDLALAGWTAKQIAEHGRNATALANLKSERAA